MEVGDGHKVHCQGKCVEYVLELQGLIIQQDVFIFYLERVDVILGIEWLASLGEVKANFGKLKLTIGRGESQQMVIGDAALSTTLTSLKKLIKKLRKEDIGCLVDLEQEEPNLQLGPIEVPRMLDLNTTFFQDLTTLPPRKT